MTSNSRGYSYNFVKKVRAANQALPGVRLALRCIERDIPATQIAAQLGVSRQAVYSWFTGEFAPNSKNLRDIYALLETGV